MPTLLKAFSIDSIARRANGEPDLLKTIEFLISRMATIIHRGKDFPNGPTTLRPAEEAQVNRLFGAIEALRLMNGASPTDMPAEFLYTMQEWNELTFGQMMYMRDAGRSVTFLGETFIAETPIGVGASLSYVQFVRDEALSWKTEIERIGKVLELLGYDRASKKIKDVAEEIEDAMTHSIVNAVTGARPALGPFYKKETGEKPSNE